MNAFSSSKWIWTKTEKKDSYVDLELSLFAQYEDGYEMRLSCDSDYALFVNGKFVASNQYADYEHYKIYDSLSLDAYTVKGENSIKITAYHNGNGSSRNQASRAGVIFEIVRYNSVVAVSDENTLVRPNPYYESGNQIFVTSQLGYTFRYDANAPFAADFEKATVVNKSCSLFPRPIPKHELARPVLPVSVKQLAACRYLVDLGREVVGLPTLKFSSRIRQTITVAWGEHILDGGVRALIKDRHFFFSYTCTEGENEFTEYMLRTGCRYLEVFCADPIELEYATVIPQYFPTTRNEVEIENELDRKIYDLCITTLELCMMEHYVDCPWREQALYVYDSRNQMLCGYYAFKDKNKQYAKSNLKLICMDRRDDGMLSICYPCSTPLCIPSFSLYFMLSMKEYIEHTSDTSLAIEHFDKMTGILDCVLSHEKNGLVERFEGAQYWNFYDWTAYSDGALYSSEKAESDLLLNCLTVIALDSLQKICSYTGKKFPYEGKADELRKNIRATFKADNGLYSIRANKDEFTVLGNTLAILARICSKTETEQLCEALVSGKLVDCSLSMKSLQYGVLLDYNEEKYAPFVLNEIRTNYSYMLNCGATSAWETIKGADDFNKAGSLCHGWSAVPIYIFHRLSVAKPTK